MRVNIYARWANLTIGPLESDHKAKDSKITFRNLVVEGTANPLLKVNSNPTGAGKVLSRTPGVTLLRTMSKVLVLGDNLNPWIVATPTNPLTHLDSRFGGIFRKTTLVGRSRRHKKQLCWLKSRCDEHRFIFVEGGRRGTDMDNAWDNRLEYL